MSLENVELIINGEHFIVRNVELRFENHIEAMVEAFIPQDIIYNHPNCKSTVCFKENERECHMAELNKVPENIERFVDENYKAFYELGWVDEDLDLTNEGRLALGKWLLKQNEEGFGKHAQETVNKLKKEEEESK